MTKKFITEKQINECIQNSTSVSGCIVALFSLVLDVKWEDCISVAPWEFWINSRTAVIILEKMYTKWDPGICNMQWMNKGFSSHHDEMNDFEIQIGETAYELVSPQALQIIDTVDLTASFAKREVEEIGEDPEELLRDAQIDYNE